MIYEVQNVPLLQQAFIWKSERNIAHLNTPDTVSFYTSLHGSAASPIATYLPDGSNDVYIDITDYVRAYQRAIGNAVTFYFDTTNNGTTIHRSLALTLRGLVNPKNGYIPYHPLQAATILPPTMFYMPSGTSVIAELYEDVPRASASRISVTGNAVFDFSTRQLTIMGNYAVNVATLPPQSKQYQPRAMRCDVNYCYVRWLSMTGSTRLHIFEIVKPTTSAQNGYSLDTLTGEYAPIRGRVDSFSLFLDNLDVYDMWYYSDIIFSSKVEVSLDGTNYMQVEVDEKKQSLPDGETKTKGKLEISINYRKYDAVGM